MTSVGYHGHCHTSRLVKFLAAVVLVLALAVEVVVVVPTIATVAAAAAAAFSLLDTNEAYAPSTKSLKIEPFKIPENPL